MKKKYLTGDYIKLHGGFTVGGTVGANNRVEPTTGVRTHF